MTDLLLLLLILIAALLGVLVLLVLAVLLALRVYAGRVLDRLRDASDEHLPAIRSSVDDIAHHLDRGRRS